MLHRAVHRAWRDRDGSPNIEDPRRIGLLLDVRCEHREARKPGDMGLERDVCSQCGGRSVRATSSWERLGRWFVYGGGMAQAYVCRSCGAAWAGGSSRYVMLSGRSGWQRWLRMPGQVVAAVRRERTWEPVPRFYAIVGAGTAVPAAVAAVVTRARGRWWWPPVSAATAIGTVFALSAVSAFRGGSAVRAIARLVAPRRAAAAEMERQAAAVRHSTAHLGVLVPAQWRGSLAIEGTRWRGRGRHRRLTGFSVAAHDLDAPDGEPRVEILHEFGGMPQVLVEHQAVATVVALESRQTMPDLAALHETEGQGQIEAAMARWRREADRREQQLQDAWQDDHVIVDGRRVPARRLAGRQAQAAVFEHDRCRIAVTATGAELSGLELTATRAIEPLLDGMLHRVTTRLRS